MRLADDVIRYMTIKLEPEAIDEENAEDTIDAEAPVIAAPTEAPPTPVALAVPVAAPVALTAPVEAPSEVPASAE